MFFKFRFFFVYMEAKYQAIAKRKYVFFIDFFWFFIRLISQYSSIMMIIRK